MSVETKNVFLDTEIFDHQNLDLLSPAFKRLTRLAAAEELSLILTDVTIAEIRGHLNKLAKAAVKQLSNYKKANRLVKGLIAAESLNGIENVTEESLSRQLQEELGRFLAVTGTQTLSVNKVPPAEIFEQYFEARAPFNDTNKKVEFPDAFAGAALHAWCKGPPAKKLYVVSGDPDWKRLCEETDEFILVKQLEELLELFADSEVVADLKQAVRGQSQEIVSLLTEKVEDGNPYFFVDDSALDGEISHVEDIAIELQDGHVVEAKDGIAVLTLNCSLSVALFISADDPDSVYRDPDDGTYRSAFSVSGSVDRDIEIDATLEISYDTANPRQIVIKSVSFHEEAIEISVERGELTRDDEDDEEEFDPQYEPEDDPEDSSAEPNE